MEVLYIDNSMIINKALEKHAKVFSTLKDTLLLSLSHTDSFPPSFGWGSGDRTEHLEKSFHFTSEFELYCLFSKYSSI